ncbi:hypothetical protein M9H77_12890 [Catharanthus roseus]|uniref:Uncharacterized protein n=1 Tax=Catharanthus roseus TaxID=4058 RepID=A0ACC0BIM9_CATRO|nr:hypothetical protein M9H77_12890 [Catharanthus roseus]
MSNLYIAWSGTLLPVPKTRIGDSTILCVVIPSVTEQLANVNPCDTPVPSDVLITGVRQCLNSYSKTIPNTNSRLVPSIDMDSMLCNPGCVVIPSQPGLVQVQVNINCIWNHLSPCKLSHHMSGIVVLHYLVTYERDLCPLQVR